MKNEGNISYDKCSVIFMHNTATYITLAFTTVHNFRDSIFNPVDLR